MVGELRVELRPPTDLGRLYPTYKRRVDILSVGSRTARPWPLGLNVDNAVILDLDADRRLANFDLLIPRRAWRTSPGLAAPPVWRRADLAFAAETVAAKDFATPVAVAAGDHKTRVLILFGATKADARAGLPAGVRAVALSDACLALLTGQLLAGFYVTLPR